MVEIKGLSSREIAIIAWLESYQKYFFVVEDIQHFFKDRAQRYNTIKSLIKKKRIIKINRNKYYLVPIKARNGGWAIDPFILADELMNGEDYFIGGWSAANYYRLTDQIPFWTEIFTTKRYGRKKIFNTGFIFKRTTLAKIRKSVIRRTYKHPFRIMNKREMKKWMKLRQSLV